MVTIAAILNFWLKRFFYLRIALILPIKFLVNWSLHSEDVQNKFSRWPSCWHLGFPCGTILSIFELHVIPILPIKFRVNRFRRRANRFSKWRPQNSISRWPESRPCWIFYQNDFSHFQSASRPDTSYQVSSQLSFGVGEKAQNRFLRWRPWRPTWILDHNDLSYFWSTSPDATYQVSSQLVSRFRRSVKYIFKMAAMAVILDFPSERFLAVLDLQLALTLPTKFRVSCPCNSEKEV